MQRYDEIRASKAKPLRIWVILGPAVVSGAQFGATASEAVKGTVQRWLEGCRDFSGVGSALSRSV